MKRKNIQVVNEPLTLKAPNGQMLRAPLGVWLLAQYDLMADAERSALFERVLAFRDEMLAHPITLADQMAGFDPKDMPIAIVNDALAPIVGDRPSQITYDGKGKRQIRMFCEPGAYTAEEINEAVGRKKQKLEAGVQDGEKVH